MSILKKIRKTTRVEEKQKNHEEISEEEAIKRAKGIMGLGRVYILLSTINADMLKGMSIPLICQLEDGRKGIIIFSKETYAREYIEKRRLEVLDGVYPIGVVEKEDKINGLHTILGIANAAKVDFLDFNPGFSDNSLGCNISWFMEVNKLPKEISMLVSKENMDKILKENKGDIPLQFNPIKINDFDNKYSLDESSSRIILQKVFEGNSYQEHLKVFAEESLFECCHTMDYLYTRMLPMAEQENKIKDIEYFKSIIKIIESVIKEKLMEEKQLFTLVDANTNEIVVKNGIVYILYTDRYKYMGQYKYKPIESQVSKWVERVGVTKAMVTDGPHGMALINFND